MTVWTPEQETLFATVEGVAAHINVQAVAGGGKTSSAIEAARRVREGKVGFVAFNRHIADHLRDKLDGRARACTLHSLGAAALRRAFPSSQLDDRKPVRLLQQVWPAEVWLRKGQPVARPGGRCVLEMARMAKLTHLEAGSTTSMDAWSRMVEAAGIEIPTGHDFGDLNIAAAKLLVAMRDETATHDFDDMLWLPVTLDLPVERFGLLFVDEAQDLSPLQRELATRACAGGRMVVVGDINQSCYAFTGADPDSIPTLCRTLAAAARGCIDRPLTVTFRCPTSHVALARQIVPQIRARDGAPEGIVRTIEAEQLAGDVRPGDVRPGDLVIARRNAPLVTLTLQLLARGVPARMVGRDLGAGLLALIAPLPPTDGIHQLISSLHDWRVHQLDALERKGAAESAFMGIEDRHKCLLELAARQPTVQKLRDFIAGLGGSENAPAEEVVSVSSIHRAKGLEAKRVYIADTECLPMILTCRKCRGVGCDRCGGRGTRSTAVQVQQERNLLYVAITRAQEELVFVDQPPAVLGEMF